MTDTAGGIKNKDRAIKILGNPPLSPYILTCTRTKDALMSVLTKIGRILLIFSHFYDFSKIHKGGTLDVNVSFCHENQECDVSFSSFQKC